MARQKREPLSGRLAGAAEVAINEARQEFEHLDTEFLRYLHGLAALVASGDPAHIDHLEVHRWVRKHEEWFPAGWEADPDRFAGMKAKLDEMSPHTAQALPPHLRLYVQRMLELWRFIFEQHRVMRELTYVCSHGPCGVFVPVDQLCTRCTRPVCVLHSRADRDQGGGRRMCQRHVKRRRTGKGVES